MFAGIISDTHGLLREEAVRALAGAERILHAGDIGDPEILKKLGKIAPVTAVRGNIDRDRWAQFLPVSETAEVGPSILYMLHNLAQLDLDPAAAGFQAVISGHSHQPLAETRRGVLYLNPGSAGPRRFRLPVSVARLHIEGKKLRAELVYLTV
ncbi:MAG TPA: metallophosphoesterase family protein [Bryobacteraceae bacterium]|nr:metallophosphoesterase family protein [Bryobacteraceae bacterium]